MDGTEDTRSGGAAGRCGRFDTAKHGGEQEHQGEEKRFLIPLGGKHCG